MPTDLRVRARLRFGMAAIGLLAMALGGGCSGPRVLERLHTSTGRVFAVPAPQVPGIPNFAIIEPDLARGGQPKDAGYRYLRTQGYLTVVSFRRNPGEREKLAVLGIDYVEIPLQAGIFGSTAPTEAQVREFFSVVTDSTRRPVFFHCKHGKDRTGTMAALYRIEVDGWTNAEAIEEMKAYGSSSFYQDLIRYVEEYRPRGYVRRGP